MKKLQFIVILMFLILLVFNQLTSAEESINNSEIVPDFFSTGIMAWNYNILSGPTSGSSVLAGPVINICIDRVVGISYIIGNGKEMNILAAAGYMIIPGLAILSGYYYESYPGYSLNGIPLGIAIFYPINDTKFVLSSLIGYIFGINKEGFFTGQAGGTYLFSNHASVSLSATITVDSQYTTLGPTVSFDYTF
ncbi:MAG: hypothetical protein HQK91_12855 [Nitrospirae bacterium]|nr:hypothetical protein [Nitrospirota bacterium]MBF0542326.1 hypothetical protein [Nitrospirota bacterium]